jgi:hypothetical protein
VGELENVGIKAYVTGNAAAQISELPKTVYGFEYLNEPDGRVHPVDYMAGLRDCIIECDKARIDGYGPTISNLIRTKITASGEELRGIEYLQACSPFPDTMKGSVHRYGDDQTVENPHMGFVSREHEVISMHLAFKGGRPWGASRPWGVSEFGWSTADMTEEQAAYNIAWEWKFWTEQMALFAVLYQIHDGPSTGAIDHFGLFRMDGTVKQAIAKTFR